MQKRKNKLHGNLHLNKNLCKFAKNMRPQKLLVLQYFYMYQVFSIDMTAVLTLLTY